MRNPALDVIGGGAVTIGASALPAMALVALAVHKRVQRNDILAMKTADSHTIYPAWQFSSDGAVRERG